MNQTEINKDLEILSNEFKSSISNYFNDKGIDIQLKTLGFTIIKSINHDNNINALEINEDKSSIEITAAHCHVNEQGQTVCSN